jgi:hypothetical protein
VTEAQSIPTDRAERRCPRVDFEADAVLELEGSRRPGRTQNLSLGGAFVCAALPLPIGSEIVLHIDLPGTPDRSAIPCIVRWVRSGVGIGLQFERLRPIEVWAICQIVRVVRDRRPEADR